MTTDVTFTREELKTWLARWQKIDDVVDGEDAIKAAGDAYLPRPNPLDESEENLSRFNQYIARAVFFNATGRTLEGLVGIAYRRPPEIEVPASMEFIEDDLDGSGGGLVNQSHRALEDVMKQGRAGLLADFPAVDQAVSRAQQVAEDVHATVTEYRAKQVINWRLDDRQNLSLVVLHETLEVADGYATGTVNQYRELAIGRLSGEDDDAPVRYVVRLWRDQLGDDQTAGTVELYQEYEPKDASGRPWNRIPFTFIGSVDNNPEIDKPPLLDLANLNLAHYRNSAEFEESTFFVGQPTHVFTGLDDQWVELMQEAGVYVGSRAAIPLPVGATALLLQAAPNTLAQEGMRIKEEQMVALGARLLTHGEAIKTAEQSRSETAAAHSVLSLACENVSAAYRLALGWARDFTQASDSEPTAFTIPTDFTGLSADPALVLALIKGWQSQALPRSDLWTALRQLGVIDPNKSDEELADEIELESPGLDLEPDDADPVPPVQAQGGQDAGEFSQEPAEPET